MMATSTLDPESKRMHLLSLQREVHQRKGQSKPQAAPKSPSMISLGEQAQEQATIAMSSASRVRTRLEVDETASMDVRPLEDEAPPPSGEDAPSAISIDDTAASALLFFASSAVE
jgi:hypothetical protein